MSDFRLKVFSSVAKNLSYTKAAQELFISQPAITRHIHELEGLYQVRLFERMGSKISLTDAGKLLLMHCDRIMDEYASLEYDMSMLHGEYTGELRLGASTTISQYVLPPLLARFSEQFPRISLSLLSGNSAEMEKDLQEHRIDLALVEGNVRQPIFKYTRFMRDELVAVVHVCDRWAACDEIAVDELKRVPLVLRENGSGTLDVFLSALQQHDIRMNDLNVCMQLGSSESIKMFLENSEAMSILSVRSVSRELYAGRLKVIDIKDLSMCRDFDFVQLQGEEKGNPSLFMQFAMRHSEGLG